MDTQTSPETGPNATPIRASALKAIREALDGLVAMDSEARHAAAAMKALPGFTDTVPEGMQVHFAVVPEPVQIERMINAVARIMLVLMYEPISPDEMPHILRVAGLCGPDDAVLHDGSPLLDHTPRAWEAGYEMEPCAEPADWRGIASFLMFHDQNKAKGDQDAIGAVLDITDHGQPLPGVLGTLLLIEMMDFAQDEMDRLQAEGRKAAQGGAAGPVEAQSGTQGAETA
jgi:hypothetical protein